MRRQDTVILAHRGFHVTHPENSLAAFRAAFEVGADGIECDLQKTSDGRYVIQHDPPSGRHDGPEPPGLEAMLASVPPGAFLNLELKADTLGPEDCAPVWEVLRQRRPPGPLLISSFDPRLLPFFKERGVPTGLLLGEEARDMGVFRLMRLLLRLRTKYLNLPILMFEVLGQRRARALAVAFRIAGFSLAFWTVNTREERELVRGLARIIITDDAAALARVKEQEGG